MSARIIREYGKKEEGVERERERESQSQTDTRKIEVEGAREERREVGGKNGMQKGGRGRMQVEEEGGVGRVERWGRRRIVRRDGERENRTHNWEIWSGHSII